MNLTLAGTIERRLLVNYRADPERVAAELPAGFAPQLVDDHAIVGICLIRLRITLAGLPRVAGQRSCNGAHRISVIDPDGRASVYVHRRDTASPLVARLGGRVFPAPHHRAALRFAEDGDGLHVTPMRIDHRESSYFDDPRRFPDGTIRLDHALLMRDIEHTWHVRPPRRETADEKTAGVF